MGNYTTEKVKKRCIELLYYWTEVLEYEPKIKEAYQMLRRQGIIKQDPEFPDLVCRMNCHSGCV
jgi:ADP-ribosylation factor-binding protein GGA